MLKTKKAQITLFIIIGIIMLMLLFAVIYFLRLEKTQSAIDKLVTSGAQTEPINQYVRECVQAIAIKGFKGLGEHGGYIDLSDEWLSGRSFSISDNPTESDAVLFSKTDFSPIAYWWYLATPNDCYNCYMDSLIPEVAEVEGQINRYIERELVNCLKDLPDFKEQGITIEEGQIRASTLIQENDVSISLDYPLTIIIGDIKKVIPSFRINLDLRFREIMELALIIALNQINNQVQEDITIHLLSIYSGVSSPNRMAPLGWIDHKNNVVTWNIDNIKENLKQYVLGSKIPLMQVDKTRDATQITDPNPLWQGLYDVLYLEFLTTGYPNLAVNFLYDPSWEIFLDITPKSGKILSPTTTNQDFLLNILPPKQTNFYQFFYDISYPVIVTIRDDYSLTKYGEQGFTFRFALETNIRDNYDLLSCNQGQCTIGEVSYDQVRFAFTGLKQGSSGDCTAGVMWQGRAMWDCSFGGSYSSQLECMQNCINETEIKFTDVQDTIATSLFCELKHRISDNITINAFDEHNNPLDDVSVSFTCGNHRTCIIGSTNENGRYVGKFPICTGENKTADGSLKLEKGGYRTEVKPHISINLNESKEYNINLKSLEEREVEIVYINITNLFKIKRKLYTEGKDNILDDLYYELKPRIVLGPVPSPILAWGHGILRDLYGQSPSKETAEHTKRILYARNLIKEMEYYHQLERNKVIEATKIARETVEYALKLVNGSLDTLSISSPTRAKLEQHLKFLNEELENIQFLQGSDLVNSANIQKYRNRATGLKPNEQVIISIEKIKENQYEQNLPLPVVMVEYNKPENINLIPGTYGITITSTDKAGYIIPKENLMPDLPNGIPSINVQADEDMNYTFVGQANLDNSSGYWTFTEDQFKNTKKVRFYLFRLDKVENIEDMGELGKIQEYSKLYRSYIEPEFLP